MTILNGIEIDNIEYNPNDIKEAITKNDMIDNTLHCIIVSSNPCNYARRIILAREFIKRFENESNVELYIVELAYGDQPYYITDKHNMKHLQLRADFNQVLWHKENMINLGVKKLLPKTWKAFAWIDADIEFESASWASDALKILNGTCDIVQLFSHAVDMDKHMNAMSIFPSFGFQYNKMRPYGLVGQQNFWHPGYCWAMTKEAYEKIGGLYQMSILGAGDHSMAFSLIGKGKTSINQSTTDGYKQSVATFEENMFGLKLGYTPGVIRHHFHGSKKNRKYSERWMILVMNNYDPNLHLTTNKDGLLIPSPECPPQLIADIFQYFSERNEDEGFKDS
jgi:hypothetical protein